MHPSSSFSPNPNSTSHFPHPPPADFGVDESTAFDASNRSFCSSDYSKARSGRSKPRLVKLRRRIGSQSKDSSNRVNDFGVSGEFVNTVDFVCLNNVKSCDFDGDFLRNDTNLMYNERLGTCGVGDPTRLDNDREFVFRVNAVKGKDLRGNVREYGEGRGEGRGEGGGEFVFGTCDGSRVSNSGLEKKECNLGFVLGDGRNGLLHSEKAEGDGNAGNLFSFGDGNLATSVGKGGKVDGVGFVFGCCKSESVSIADAKFEKSRVTVGELKFSDMCKENVDSEMEHPNSKVDCVFEFGSAGKGSSGLCGSSWLCYERNKLNVEKCSDKVKEDGDTMHSVANSSINFVFRSSSGFGNDLRRRRAVKLSDKMQKMNIHESQNVDDVDTCKDSTSSSTNLDIEFVFGSDKKTSVSTTGSLVFTYNQAQYSSGTAPQSSTMTENSENIDMKNSEEKVAGSFGEGVEGTILDAMRNRNAIFGSGLFGEQNIPSCSTSETLGKENQPINLTEKIIYGKQFLCNKLNYDREVNKSSYPSSSIGFHFHPGDNAHEASIGDRIRRKDTEHTFTSNPVQSGSSFTGFNTRNVDTPANLFTGFGVKLDFGTSDRSAGGRRLKKTRGKLRKSTLVKNEKSREYSSCKNEAASDCFSPMDFSPCQEKCSTSPTCSNISTKAAYEGLAATRVRSDTKEGGNICSGAYVGGLKDLGETQLQFERVDNVSADFASTEVGARKENNATENHDEKSFSTSSSRQSNISATKPRKKYRMKIGRVSDSTSSSWRADLAAPSVKFFDHTSNSSCSDESQTQKVGILNTQSRGEHTRVDKKQGKQDLPLAEILEECERWRIRGNQAYKKGSLSKAENLYTKCIDSITHTKATECCIEPLVLCYSNRAATHLSLGKIREALEDCRKAASLDPNFQKTLMRAAKCHLILGEVEDAKHYFNKCLESGIDVCLDRRIMIEAAEGLQKSEKVVKCMNDSTDLLKERTSEAVGNALTIIIEALAISSYSEKLLKMKGEALCMLRRYEEVVQLCEQTLDFAEKNFGTMGPAIQLPDGSKCKLSDSRVWRWSLISQSYFHMGRLEASLELIKKLEKLRYVENKSEEKDSLVILADKLRKLLHLKNAGNKAFQCGKHTEAVEHYTAAILNSVESRSFAAVCFCNRAAAHQALGKISDAIADCSLAIALDGSYGKALSRRATLHELIRDYEQAANDLRRFISVLQMQSKEMNKQSDTPLGKCGNRENLQEARDRLSCMERKAKKGTPLDFYLILGIKSSDNASDIKKAYHKAALKHHPDKAGQFLAKSESDDEGQLRKELADKTRVDADRLFKMIGEAYAVLSDNNKRSTYDVEEEIRNEKAKNKGSSFGRESKVYTSPFESRSSREYGRDWRTYDGESWRTYGKSSSRW